MLRAAARIIVSLWLLSGGLPAAMAMFRHSDAPASAGKRVALVIGVNKYPNLAAHAQLQRAVNDAHAVAKAFGELGFEVTALEDTGRAQFNEGWQQFLAKTSDGDTVAFYFAGHGVEIEGLNFLIPGDIPPVQYGRQEQIKRESIAVSELLLDLHKRRPGVVLIILDACREHPLIPEEYRSAGAAPGGLAKIDAPQGTFIMYSAAAGQTALDRLPGNDPDPVNSVYTRKLLPLMRQKGVGLVDLARKVRGEVYALAATVPHQQMPAYYDGVLNTFCLAGCEAGGQEAAAEKSSESVVTKKSGPLTEQPQKGTQTAAVALNTQPAPSQTAVTQSKPKPKPKPALAPEYSLEGQIVDLKPTWGAVSAPPAPAIQAEPVCDGLLVSVAQSKAKPCIKPGSGESFKDCPDCPEMVIAPAGSFSMGSPESEPNRQTDEAPQHKVTIDIGEPFEAPQHKVTIREPFAVGRFAVTRDEFEAFVKDSGYQTDGGCYIWTRSTWNSDSAKSWRSPGFTQTGVHPVVCVNWNDTKAYVAWLSKKTGKEYRLLSEAEREYVARAGRTTPFWWGSQISVDQANYDGNYTYNGGSKGEWRQKTVPVKSFQANPWGLYQVHGNVWDLVEDCWHGDYHNAPSDGSAWTTGECKVRMIRGGSWINYPRKLRAAYRDNEADGRYNNRGFRVALGWQDLNR